MQTTTISFFRYSGFSNRLWGMRMMRDVRKPLRNHSGVTFFKPLGTGGGAGYSLKPDFSVYGLLVVWDSEELATEFLESALYQSFIAHSTEQYTLFLQAVRSKGSWSGFHKWRFAASDAPLEPVAALTRATLKPGFLIPFWRMTPRVSREHENYKGLLFSKGVGEIPFLEQATFTVWESVADMESFAFRTFHGDAVRLTRERDGFSEQMFTRFRVLKTYGKWNGVNPLRGMIPENQNML